MVPSGECPGNCCCGGPLAYLRLEKIIRPIQARNTGADEMDVEWEPDVSEFESLPWSAVATWGSTGEHCSHVEEVVKWIEVNFITILLMKHEVDMMVPFVVYLQNIAGNLPIFPLGSGISGLGK